MYRYIYKLIHIKTGEYYIGSRTSNVHPTLDGYMGSMKTWKTDKHNLLKEIIKEGFNSIDDLLEYEAFIIEQCIEDPLNRNYSIPKKGFRTNGMVTVKDENNITFLVSVNDERYLSGELVPAIRGTQLGKIVVIDKDGYKFKVDKNDPRYLSGELKYILSGVKLKLNKRLDKNHSSKFTQVGELNSQFGTCWITNGTDNKKIKKGDIIPEGWKLGRKQKK